MNSPLKIGISGIRGIPEEGLTPEIVISLARCFGQYLAGGRVVVGRDPRSSSQSLKYQVFSGLILAGSEIIDLGIAATPTVQIMVSHLKASGGLVITASHNPLPWNGLKFINREGIFLNDREFQAFLNLFISQIGAYKKISWREVKNIETFHHASKVHLGKILEKIDVQKIRQRKFKVALDTCNGSAKEAAITLLTSLNCQIIPVNTQIDGTFHRSPEPVSENLKELKKQTVSRKADLGLAFDPDGDRLAVVTEKGEAPGEEYTLALATEFILSKKRGPVVTNLSTSRLIDDICQRYRVPLVRTKIGEINVSYEMKKIGGVIGGEGNGGVIWPEIGLGRDGLAAMALILNYLARVSVPISTLIKKLPQYFMLKEKYSCASLEKIGLIIDQLTEEYRFQKINLQDGLKIEGNGFWVHIRGSNTEPIIRVIAEAKTKAGAQKLVRQVLRKIKLLAA